jgi:hypothetical protein
MLENRPHPRPQPPLQNSRCYLVLPLATVPVGWVSLGWVSTLPVLRAKSSRSIVLLRDLSEQRTDCK